MSATLKFLYLLSFVFIADYCSAQSKDDIFYAFDANWNATKSIDSCTYFMQLVKKSDTEYICRYYNKFGPMIKQESYRDENLATPNGFFCWYNDKGKLDSSGWVLNFKKDGRWDYYMGDSLEITFYENYENGKFLKRGAFHQDGDTTNVEKDPTEKPAVFKNSISAWTKYVYSNIITPDRFTQRNKPGKYVVSVLFTIGKTGKVENTYLIKSIEWSADAEVFKIIESSPVWQPAIQHGKPVLFRERQNITFQISY